MDNHTFPYTAYFKLYRPDGLQISFGISADDAAAHLNQLTDYLTRLATAGFLPQMPGLEDDEKIEEVDAWVLGETSKGEPCVFLYAASHGLQFRIATIYVERIPDMPFTVNGAKKWDASAAPTRDEAEKKGYLKAVPAFKVVMEPRGTTEDGKQTWRFARLHGAPVAPPAPATQQPANGNGKHAAADAEFASIPNAFTERALAIKSRIVGNTRSDEPKAHPEIRLKFKQNLAIAVTTSEERHALTAFMFGTDDAERWTQGQLMAANTWLAIGKAGDGYAPSAKFLDDWKVIKAAIMPAVEVAGK